MQLRDCESPRVIGESILGSLMRGRSALAMFASICMLSFTPQHGLAFQSADDKVLAQQPVVPARTYTNPVLWEDLPDLDVIRVGDAYYYSASNMHYSPGAPLLRSYDLVHWQYVPHSIPVLDFSPAYDLNGGNAYVKGSWASFLGYRKSNATFYWGGCIEFKKTYIYTAPKAEGPWQRHAVLDHCYYDAGLLIDENDTMYVAYGNTTLHVAQLSPDATHEVRSEVVFRTPPDIGVLEGSRFYKIGGNYYIFATRPANGEYVLRSTTGPFGPYVVHKLLLDTKGPITGGGVPHQGGIVQTQKGDWYYMAFVDAFPGGRVPVLTPLYWDADGWPSLHFFDNTWPASGPMPDVGSSLKIETSVTGTDTFGGKSLSPEWEWNHNPDNTKWSLSKGVHLQTATVTPRDDLYAARNTLTHRIPGPSSIATVEMHLDKMKDGDRAGLVMLRDKSAWIGIERDGKDYRIAVRAGLTMDTHWRTASTGADTDSVPLGGKKVWLRAAADIRPGADQTAHFFYSVDGDHFEPLGKPFVMNNAWQFFVGYRFGIFNYATKALGGRVTVSSFAITQP